MLRVIALLCFCLCYIMVSAEAAPKKQVKISVIEDLAVIDKYRALILKAYTGIDYQVEFLAMPAAREILEINKGTVDAITIRLSVIEPAYPDFVRVPVLLATGDFFLYCQLDLPCDKTILASRDNLVGLVVGVNFASLYMNDYSASVYKSVNAKLLGELLIIKRLNYILTLEVDGYGNLTNLDSTKFNRVNLERVEAYHYIHRRIEHLLPELTQSLNNVLNSHQ